MTGNAAALRPADYEGSALRYVGRIRRGRATVERDLLRLQTPTRSDLSAHHAPALGSGRG
jgi:hypothetical protein